jgi:hypothetical protein
MNADTDTYTDTDMDKGHGHSHYTETSSAENVKILYEIRNRQRKLRPALGNLLALLHRDQLVVMVSAVLF